MTAEHDPGYSTLRSGGNARPAYIHELGDWPRFRWHDAAIAKSLTNASRRLEKLIDRADGLEPAAADEITVQNLTQSAVASSNIESEFPNPHAVRRAIASYIAGQYQPPGGNAPGIAAVTADAAINRATPLTKARLHQWHRWLFPVPAPGITVGRFRDDRFGPMQVVSGGPMGRPPTVHFVAPAAHRLQQEMDRFLAWFNAPSTPNDLRKPAIAHLWFVTIHPYDDGNGRITRAISDLALAQWDGSPHRCYSMSAEIMRRRNGYYDALQITQSASMDVTTWMIWFLECLAAAAAQAEQTEEAAQGRARLRAPAQSRGLNDRQVKFIDRLIDGWTGNITAARYRRVNRCTQAQAEQDLARLVELGILAINEASSRQPSYRMARLP